MPQITSIEPQKKKSGRLNIFIDGKFSFSLSEILVFENNLKVDAKLNESKISKIVSQDKNIKLTDLAIRFLSYRPRSEDEMKNYLAKKIANSQNIKFSQAKESTEIEIIIAKLKKYKYINDQEFVDWFIKSRRRSNPKGKIALKYELKQKGIGSDLIEKSLKKITNETDLAKKIIEKKLKRWHKLSNFELKKKIYQQLGMKGFSLETIKDTFAFFKKKS